MYMLKTGTCYLPVADRSRTTRYATKPATQLLKIINRGGVNPHYQLLTTVYKSMSTDCNPPVAVGGDCLYRIRLNIAGPLPHFRNLAKSFQHTGKILLQPCRRLSAPCRSPAAILRETFGIRSVSSEGVYHHKQQRKQS